MAINSTGQARAMVYGILIDAWTSLFPTGSEEARKDVIRRLLLPNNRTSDGSGINKLPTAPPAWASVVIFGTRSTPATIGNTDFYMESTMYVDVYTEHGRNMDETDRIATGLIDNLLRSGTEVEISSAVLKERGSDGTHFISRVEARLRYEMHY